MGQPESGRAAGGKWWILAGLWLLYASFGLVVASVAPMVQDILAELSMSHSAMGSVMGAWQLVYIFAAIPCGILLDRIGGRYALLMAAALIGASALGRAFATDYFSFLIAVMLFGVGGPIVSSGAPKVVAEYFTGSQRGLAMGIYMTGPAIGGVVCLTMTNAFFLPLFDMNWRAVMALWGVVALFAGGIWWLLASILQVDKRSAANRAESTPQLQIMAELIKAPAVRVLLLMSVGVFLYNHGLNNWLPELLRQGGKSAVQAGYWAALPTVVGILGSLLIPRLATPERRFHILIVLCLAALLASVLLQALDNITLTTGLILQGVARSSLMTVLILTLVELPGIGEQRVGVASGMFFSAAEIGGMLGPLGMGVIFDVTGGFSASLWSLSIVSAAMIGGAFYLKRLAGRGHPPGQAA
ncbi:MAG: CynX/NimT family MFS transporter [bacterium]